MLVSKSQRPTLIHKEGLESFFKMTPIKNYLKEILQSNTRSVLTVEAAGTRSRSHPQTVSVT